MATAACSSCQPIAAIAATQGSSTCATSDPNRPPALCKSASALHFPLAHAARAGARLHEPARRSALSASVMRVGRAQFLHFRVSQCVHVLRATPVFREAGRTRCDHALTVALHFDVIVGAAVALYFDVIVGAVQRHLVAAASRGPPREASSTSLPRLCIEHIVARPTGGQACVAPCVARGCHPDTAGAFASAPACRSRTGRGRLAGLRYNRSPRSGKRHGQLSQRPGSDPEA